MRKIVVFCILYSISCVLCSVSSVHAVSTETVNSDITRNLLNLDDSYRFKQAGKNLQDSSKSKIIGMFLSLIGYEVLQYNRNYDNSNTFYIDFLGTALLTGGIFSYFIVSSGYEYMAAENFMGIKNMSLTEPVELLSPKNKKEEFLTKEKVIEAIKKVKGVTIKEGIEIEKIAITVDAKTLGVTENSEITTVGGKILNEVANVLIQNPGEKVVIEGHTDSLLAPDAAVKVSEERAKKVLNYYTKEKKLPEERFEVKGYGASQPVVSNATEEGRTMNNRVVTSFKREKEPVENSLGSVDASPVHLGYSEQTSKSISLLSEMPGVVVNRAITEKITKIVIADEAIYFSFNSDNIQPEYYLLLDKIARLIEIYFSEKSIDKIEIAGHTDNIGDDAYNINLSKRRAGRVKEYFMEKKSFPEEKFVTVAYGENKPVSDNLTERGRAKNRRVEISLKKMSDTGISE